MQRLALALFLLPLFLISAPADTGEGPRAAGSTAALKPVVTGLDRPESVCVGPDGRIYVTCIGEFNKDGDGSVVAVKDGKAVPFATGLDDPKGIVASGGSLFVADKTRVWRIDNKGKAHVHVAARAFPNPPQFLNDLEADPNGVLYVSDSGDLKGKGGAVYRVDQRRRVTTVVDGKKSDLVRAANGLRFASEYHLHVLDAHTGDLLLVRLADGRTTKVADGFGVGDGIAADHYGRVYLTDWKSGKLFVIPRPGMKPVLLASGFRNSADVCLSRDGRSILVPDMTAGTLTAVPATVPGMAVDESPLPVGLEPAYAGIEWTGWDAVSKSGKVIPQRPIVLTHAGDGSHRVFMATQRGVVHVFPEKAEKGKSTIFLDIEKRVKYTDAENEEGFLGLAFHPQFKKTGEFFVYYTPRREKLVNYLSRFRLSKTDPDRADPESEEVLLKFKKPFWNHDGGTIVFGPDGKLYVAVGDGGAANDPFENGQNLKTLLGKILRIDVDGRGPGVGYTIPKDNPFVKQEGARGEIWAYGLRNVWRMSFDRKTGELWAADVGQNLWEEINLIEKGGNYGWNPREALHPFGFKGVMPNSNMIDPIWEYHHDVGKSVTGGHVYRGKKAPALDGLYLYADYVTGHIWGLRYDRKQKRVTENHWLRRGGSPVMSFGEDESGEVYILTSTPNGKGIFRFVGKK